MNTEKRVAIACFIGAALGALLALQFNPYFWWLGILLGGGVGYCCFRFQEGLRTAYAVWKSLPDVKAAGAAVRTVLWESARLIGVLLGLICVAVSFLALLIGGILSLVMETTLPEELEGPLITAKDLEVPRAFWGVAAAVLLFAGLFLVICILRSANRKEACWGVVGCLLMSPLFLPIALTVAIAGAVARWAGKTLLKFSVLSFKTARQTFITIHSEIRLLCLTDALVGALTGYCCGNALIGGLVGALCGVADYRFISVRWLKLAKA